MLSRPSCRSTSSQRRPGPCACSSLTAADQVGDLAEALVELADPGCARSVTRPPIPGPPGSPARPPLSTRFQPLVIEPGAGPDGSVQPPALPGRDRPAAPPADPRGRTASTALSPSWSPSSPGPAPAAEARGPAPPPSRRGSTPLETKPGDMVMQSVVKGCAPTRRTCLLAAADRVVELVGQAGGPASQRGQLLLLTHGPTRRPGRNRGDQPHRRLHRRRAS